MFYKHQYNIHLHLFQFLDFGSKFEWKKLKFYPKIVWNSEFTSSIIQRYIHRKQKFWDPKKSSDFRSFRISEVPEFGSYTVQGFC
jgi:hypothetical protein